MGNKQCLETGWPSKLLHAASLIGCNNLRPGRFHVANRLGFGTPRQNRGGRSAVAQTGPSRDRIAVQPVLDGTLRRVRRPGLLQDVPAVR